MCFCVSRPAPPGQRAASFNAIDPHALTLPGDQVPAIAAGPCLSTSVSKARGIIKRLNCPPHGSLGRVLSQSSSLFVPRALEPTPYMGKALSHLQRFDPEESPQLFAG